MPWVGVGGGVPPELGKLPPPVFEMLLFTGDICNNERSILARIGLLGENATLALPAWKEVMTELRTGSLCDP